MKFSARKLFKSFLVALANRSYSTYPRVRFAPSPTGDLHLGGLRTALYNYLYAKKHGGTMVLRIEDTDRTRFVPGSAEKLIEALKWIGINPDEGPGLGGSYGPYIQSERKELYQDRAKLLLQNKTAYRCFCSEERLELLRKDQLRTRSHFGYDNLCRSLSESKINNYLSIGRPYVIRFKLDSVVGDDWDGASWKDLIYDDMVIDTKNIEGDPIILKSDGMPTYHLANVIDDHFMEITHVLRGAEWQSSTIKHLSLFKAFNWKPPQYAHLPLLLDSDGTKLSKRKDAPNLINLKKRGYLPEAVISMLCLCGGGIRIQHEKITEEGVRMDDAITQFSLNHVHTQNTVLDVPRLDALNRACLRYLYKAEMREEFCSRLHALVATIRPENRLSEQDKVAVHILYDNFLEHLGRISTLKDLLCGEYGFIWKFESNHTENFKTNLDKVCLVLTLMLHELKACENITHSHLSRAHAMSGLNKAEFFRIVRIALTNQKAGLPLLTTLQLLSKKEVIKRLQESLQKLEKKLKATDL